MSQCDLEEVPVMSGMQELAPRLPSYRPYPWTFANRVFDVIDNVTGGRAGVCQRFATYVVIGGFAALVNLAVFYVVFYYIPLPFIAKLPNADMVRNVIASVFAAEISIMANFIPNDFVTFRHLPGRARSWSARCSRFHITSIGGSILTFLIQFGLTHFVGRIPAFAAQTVALILVLFYNFSFHHIFTYRHVKLQPAK